jgi:deazaflavin-dependent oxidoreductase (nitroreductase family)
VITIPPKNRLFSKFGGLMSRPSMRPLTRWMTNAHVALYRATGGWAQIPGYPTMLMTVRGRKSGKPRTVPLIYVRDGERFVIAAAYAGAETHPAWWSNLRAAGEAELLVNRERIRVRAQAAGSEERARLWPKLCAMYPYFTDYEGRTTREIPVVLLEPITD